MMYPYITLGDETEVVHSHIIEENDIKKVIVNFEQATEDGFRNARCELPSYNWITSNGYSKKELDEFIIFLRQEFLLLKQNV